ncbi:MAG: glycerol-3-phosphate 1-O-acyltransferase PlsY [Oscillospiraceae bacterium]|nr:glycerol-3-phosphate 1-O-acyltransferase PlsY [Oscillospiraceae bacterium]
MHNVTVAFAVLLVMLLSYFFGCFNGSFMVSHFIIRDDVRKHGSGNAGLTNFYRTYGAKYALLVIACDMGKTVVACLLGSFFFRCLGWDGTLGTLLAGLGCELGHIFPVFYGFRGGKGILSGGTLVLLLNWRVAAVAWALFLLLWLTTRYVSLASITATCSAPITVYFVYGHNWLYTGLCLAVAALVVWCHRENIQRLLHGTEKKFKWHVNPTEGKDPPK